MLEGALPQPSWVPRRVLTVVSADVDITAGVGALWVVWRPKSARAREHILLLERHEGQWRYVGGSIAPADAPDDVDVIDVRTGGGALSLTGRHALPYSGTTAPWIGCAVIHLGREVSHLLIDNRRIDAPDQHKLIVAWMTSHAVREIRPLFVVFGRDGTELSRLGPHDSLDTHTWARLKEEG
ncbi:hypothetical protein ACH4FX_36660 [Streptomyces sp. NPDC018019]|uniref:hypothetical protein n=1 Tax=Streptomyces sp. NPDC018019 TaxID=3365030 RepID=UPI0037B8D7E3